MSAVCVVVVNWNRCDLLRACLDSLRRQTHSDFEVIVVDNGSTDGSKKALKTYQNDAKMPLKVIENASNRGFCEANNQGFAASDSRFIALLNNDAEAEPGWLTALQAAIESNGDAGMAASKILVHEDPRVIDKVGHLIYLDGQNRGRGSGELDVGQYETMEEVLWPDGCAAMYRREVINCIGGFDEDFFAYADDADLGLRARIAGWKCLYAPGAIVWHHRGSTLGLVSTRRLELIERNRVLLAVKLFPWSLLWLNGVFYMARILAGLWAAAAGKGEVRRFPGLRGKLRLAACLIRGDFQALTLLPRILRKRREIRKYRRLSQRQVRELLLRNRITLKELSQQSI